MRLRHPDMMESNVMRLVKNAYKAWSTWGLGVIALFEGVRQTWPILKTTLPTPVYDYVLFGLAVLVLVLRFIDQGLKDA